MALSPALERQLSRFKRLPQTEDVWEGAVAPLPAWVDSESGGDPYRPIAGVWVSTAKQLVHIKMADSEGPADGTLALTTLVEMGTSAKLARYRPRVLRVRDERLAAFLTEELSAVDTLVELVPELPILGEVLGDIAADQGETVPAALDAPGVTPDRLRAFADAAKQFYDAAPWRHLNDGDLLQVEAPKAGRGLVLFSVMGSVGLEFGLGFFSSVAQYGAVMEDQPPDEVYVGGGEWAIYFSPAWETPFGDLAAWDAYELPLATERAYPTAMRVDASREVRRPDAGRLSYFEGLLRALAATTELEMDSGRWAQTVETADGAIEYVLTLPDLLEPLPSPASIATTPLDRARDLIDEAFDARGRRELHLIRQALEVSPDCADAYALLAERASTASDKRLLFEQAVAAGARALGAGAFEDPDREFWEDVSTRPYMRARFLLADCLWAARELDAAAEHLRGLLQLNPHDNQGARYQLMAVLLDAGRNDDAQALLDAYDETTARWAYAAVLLALRAGDRRLARSRLHLAVKSNRHVPKYLTGQRELPDLRPPFFEFGSDDEAIGCAEDLIDQWTDTPGAVAWLRTETRGRR